MEINNSVLQELGEQVVLDEEGNSRKVSLFWQMERAVLVFVRHFG